MKNLDKFEMMLPIYKRYIETESSDDKKKHIEAIGNIIDHIFIEGTLEGLRMGKEITFKALDDIKKLG